METNEPGASPSASPSETTEPVTPAPSVEVSPGPDGAIEIARDVTLVGASAAYSDDGDTFAFSARPADGSTGPDIYIWQAGDAKAVAITTDHRSVFAGWLGDKVLVSRVTDGVPTTAILDRSTNEEQPVGNDTMWRPTVSPDERVAAWWDGTVKLGTDGITWVPDQGRLILAPWPDAGQDAQVLTEGPISGWEVSGIPRLRGGRVGVRRGS